MPINLEALQQFYRSPADTNQDYAITNDFPVAPVKQSPAADVLFALSKYDGVIEELRAAADQRPLSRFPLNYDSEIACLNTLDPHFNALQDCLQVLQLRTAAELEDNQSKKALADIELMLRLMDSIRNEPLIESQFARTYMFDWTVQVIWESLAKHRWSEAQLVGLSQMLASLDFASDFETAVRGNQAGATETIEFMRLHPSKILNFIRLIEGVGSGIDGKYDPSSYDLDDPYRTPALPGRMLGYCVPDGWFYQNKISIGKMYQPFLRPAGGPAKEDLALAVARYRSATNFDQISVHPSPNNIMALIQNRFSSRAWRTFFESQTWVEMALVACALERYHLTNGQYPATLKDLTPQFMVKLPTDPINSQPLHYQLRNGQPVLYSVGWNEKDDGGVAGSYDSGRMGFRPRRTEGDWVWTYPPE